jgi:hypothetical protein
LLASFVDGAENCCRPVTVVELTNFFQMIVRLSQLLSANNLDIAADMLTNIFSKIDVYLPHDWYKIA